MPRILFITHTPPWPTDNGGHQRTHLLLRALQRCGDVDLFLLPRSPAGHPQDMIDHLEREFRLVDYVEPVPRGKHGPWRMARPLSPKWADRFAGVLGSVRVDYAPDPLVHDRLRTRLESGEYDIVIGRYLQPTVRSGALDHQPLILDVDDVDTDRCKTQLALTGQNPLTRALLRRRLHDLEQIVPPLLAQPDHIWTCSEADRKAIGTERSTVLPNIPFFAPDPARESAVIGHRNDQRILFVGSLTFGVNVRGVESFLRNAWPTVLLAHPQAIFRIVGTGLSAKQQARWGRTPGVELAGRVDDLGEEYARCAFSVVPLFEGGGTKIKVLESLVFGRTCVVARHAQRGFEHALKDQESLAVADDLATFSAMCCALLADTTLRDRLEVHGQAQVSNHFTFERFARIVEQTVDTVLRDHAQGLRRIEDSVERSQQ